MSHNGCVVSRSDSNIFMLWLQSINVPLSEFELRKSKPLFRHNTIWSLDSWISRILLNLGSLSDAALLLCWLEVCLLVISRGSLERVMRPASDVLIFRPAL